MYKKLLLSLSIFLSIISITKAYNGSFFSLNSINGYDISIENAVQLGDTIIFINLRQLEGNNWTDDLCMYFNGQLKTYEQSAFNLPDKVTFNSLYSAARDSNNDIVLGTNVGLVIFDGNQFSVYSPTKLNIEHDNNIFDFLIFDGKIYAIGSYGWLLSFQDGKFTFLKGNENNNLDSTKWIVFPFENNGLPKIKNKLYFKLENKKIASYDLDSSKFFLTDLATRTEIGFSYKIINFKLIDNKIYYMIDDPNRFVSYYMIFDGEKVVLDSAYKDLVAPGKDRCIIENDYKDSHGNRYYQVLAGDSANANRYYLFVDSNGEVINWHDLVSGDDNFHKSIMNVLCLSDGKVYYATNYGGFIIYDPMGTGVEKTDVLPSLYLYNAFPNPVSNILTLKIATPPKRVDELKINLYDYLGVKIASLAPQKINLDSQTGFGTLELDMSGVLPGCYYLQIKNKKDTRGVLIIKN